MAKTTASKITVTRNYRLFDRSEENRPLDLKKHRKLYGSMKKYGFLSCFPIACARNGDKHLVVKDGQHRLAIAEELDLPVSYVVEAVDFDIADVNCTGKGWTPSDYANKWADCGKHQYKEGIEFSKLHGLTIAQGFCLLAGQATFGNINHKFCKGEFEINDRRFAEVVATVYSRLAAISKNCRNARCMDACMAVCRVKEFEPGRLVKSAERCREKLVAYSNRDAYLDMFEEIYNYGRKQLTPLKIYALQAMRERNPIHRKERHDD